MPYTSCMIVRMICIMSLACWIPASFADDPPADQVREDGGSAPTPSMFIPDQESAGVECGLYAVIAAVKVEVGHCDADRVLYGKYLSHEWGSSAKDLCRAISDCGAFSLPMRGIGLGTLQDSPHPIIIHLSTRRGSECPGHWVVYLGEDEGAARIYDPNATPRLTHVSYAELLSSMSGAGIVVLRRPPTLVDRLRFYRSLLITLSPWLAFGLVAGSLGKLRSPPSTFAQLAILVVFASIWSLGEQAGSPHGLLWNRELAGWIESKYMDHVEIPSVGYLQLKTLRKRADVTIVDARTESQYKYGHLPDAIHVPIDARPGEFIQMIRGIPRGNAIIVYCNDEQCGWADIVARRMKAVRFPRVFVYREGIMGYLEQRRQETKAVTGEPS